MKSPNFELLRVKRSLLAEISKHLSELERML